MMSTKLFKNIILVSIILAAYLLYNGIVRGEITFFSKIIQTRSQKITKDNMITFVINLDRTPQRYENVKAQLDSNNIKHERFSAADGYNLEITNKETGEKFLGSDLKSGKMKILPNIAYGIECPISGEIIYKSNKVITAGELGCFCSHRDVWQKMINENIKDALIVEDDVTLIDKFNYSYTNLLNKLPYQWDVIYLYYLYYDPKPLKKVSNIVNNKFLQKFNRDKQVVHSTAGYMINTISAKKLIELTKNVDTAIDDLLSQSINNEYLKAYKTSIEYLTAPFGEKAKDSIIHEMGRENS